MVLQCKSIGMFGRGIVLLSVMMLGAGCETVVDVEAPAHEPRLVAHGFFTTDSLWVVRVTRSVPFTSVEAPPFVDDATVEIWEGNRLVAAPALSDSGTYVATGPGAEPGRTYTLRASAPGLASVEGRDALPEPPVVTEWQETPFPAEVPGSRRQRTRVSLTLDDAEGVPNRYGLLVVQLRWSEDRQTGQLTPLPPSLFPFESDNLALGESETAFLGPDAAVYREAFFTDGLFDGRPYSIEFDIQYDAPHPEADVVIHRVFVVAVLSASEHFYRYWTTAGQQAFSNENPFAEPLRVHANVEGGFGVFAGFRYRLFVLHTGSLDEVPASLCTMVGGRLPICGTLPALP